MPLEDELGSLGYFLRWVRCFAHAFAGSFIVD